MKIHIVRSSIKMKIIDCWGFRNLSWFWLPHSRFCITSWQAFSPNVSVPSAFVTTNRNDKMISFMTINVNKIIMHHVVNTPRASKHNCHQTPFWKIAVTKSSYPSDPSGSKTFPFKIVNIYLSYSYSAQDIFS